MSKLADWLISNDISQAEFGKRIGMSQGGVSKLCTDGSRISAEKAVEIERETKGAVKVESWPRFHVLNERHTSPEISDASSISGVAS